jgi:hypothetical protein
VHTSCDSRTAIGFVSEGSEGVKTALLSFKLNQAQPDSPHHQRLRMTGTEPHAPRGTAGRGPNWDRGPRAGHAGAARRCTKRHRRLWALPGPLAVHGPRKLRVDACTSRHRRPRDHFWDRWLRTGRRSNATWSGPTRLRMPISAPPAAGPARGPWAASWPEELCDSERSHGCRREAVTVCFQYLVPQVTVSDDSTIYLNWLCSIQNWASVAPSIKSDCW